MIKAELRARLLADRHARPRSADNALVRARLADLARGVDSVAGFVPMPAEPGGPELPGALATVCGRLLLPVLQPDNDLDWAVYRGSLVPAPRGLREPPGPPLGPDWIGTASLVIVPALAVDRRGVRLGRGGGSYDRALSRVSPGTLVVAALYDGELLDEVPEQPHDRRVGAVVTPSDGLIRLPVT
ncbi:MAG TPA: 5-formyltetrahydrofolate cyclo-ligase [Rugosimonospora sp.]|nr:5-formyltetrahydrofolate cyclo-ligase [Rugosimonospora sp.]